MKAVNHLPLRIAITALLAFPMLAFGQVRPDIFSFTSQERAELADLIIDYTTVEVIQMHCDYTTIMGASPGTYDIHDNFNFLPFHRTYLERLEDWLLDQGYPQYVPLPKWTGLVPPPIEFSTAGPNGNGVSPACGDPATTCANAGSDCSTPTGWTSVISLPPILQLPVLAGTSNDLCDLPFSPAGYSVDNDNSFPGGLSNVMEE